MTIEKTEAQTIADLSQKPFVQDVSGIPFTFTPKGDGAWDFASLEAHLEKPARKKGTTTLHDVESFIATCKRYGSLGSAVIYINADYTHNKVEATAIFNEHGDDGNPAGWRDHKALFIPRQTKQWQDWISFDSKKLNQIDLANFFEQNISDFAATPGKPTGGEVLTFVTCLQETRTVKYGSAINLQNGLVQLEFTEDNEKAQKGKLELFKEFSLGLSPFFGGEAIQVDAFLRYRIDRNTGGIAFWYELKKPEKVLEFACANIIKQIKEQTGLPVLFGTP